MDRTSAGWGSGLLGVIIFSGSLPATRLAVEELSPLFLTSARAAIAGLLGAACLLALRQRRPARADLVPLAVVALGVVVGYPLLSALALQYVSAAHSAVFLGLLPLSTAFFGVLRGGERPHPAFWIFSLLGAAIVAGFALSRGADGSLPGDLLMLAGILVCGLGYAEGAALSRRLGGWQVISWALLLALLPMAAIALATTPVHPGGIGVSAWAGLFYVSVFSMLVGFVFWYRGLALGGIAGVGQLQLMQPFFGLLAAALVLHEPIAWTMTVAAAAVILCVAGAKRFA
ncbi:transporter [Erythrobacter sp. SG61-1L]|uniref:DMT family transporter n=1 Tax=Erythrobacter sp. SG61-1L TaxID=1603897 RepID=UPI0006C8F282|nr:DMT family transporter [Erythrobacter sp. SG61-1L]KPL69152.1 transporter [Erythrobacter sp. SG61-1L]